jgi:excisionase family DNA binding protein
MEKQGKEPWVPIEAVAEYLAVSVSWVRKAVREWNFPVKRCGRSLRFRLSDIDEYLESQEHVAL